MKGGLPWCFLVLISSASDVPPDQAVLMAEARELISRWEAIVHPRPLGGGSDEGASALYRRLQTLAAGEAGNLFPPLPTLTLAPHLEAEANEPAAVATTTAEPAAFTTTAEQSATTTTAEQAATTTTTEQAATTTTAEQAATTTTAEQAAATTSESTTSEVADEPTLGEADVAASSVGEGGDITGATEEEIWAEEEKEEEKEEFSPVDVGCSWTLIGSLFFTMVMFYFVNYPDDDIKRYTWSIINSTLSIFTAVLTFQGIDDLVMHVAVTPALGAFPSGWGKFARVVIGFLIFLAWYCFALLAIALSSGVLKHEDSAEDQGKMWVISDFMRGDHGTAIKHQQLVQGCRSKGIAAVNGVEVFVASRALIREGYETRTKCWSTLFAHMAGFAMISAGGDLQSSPFFMDNPGASWLAIVVCIIFLLCIFSLSGFFYRRCEGSEAKALFMEESIEAEDDIICLAVSFMMIQSMRFTITGSLPSKLGLYHKQATETAQTTALYVTGILAAAFMVAVAMAMPRSRVKNLVVGTLSMGFAWAFLFATRSLYDSWDFLLSRRISPITIEGRILLAMTLSLFSCLIIVILDKFEDNLTDDADDIHKALKKIITGLSILIGFTWEHTFDGCVEAISSLFSDPLAIKLALTSLIVLIVVPAWRMYILAKVVHLEKARHEQREAMEGSSTGHGEGSSSDEASTKLLC